MHTWIPILVEDVNNFTLPDEEDMFELLQREYGADYFVYSDDTEHPAWLKNLENEDGTYSLKKDEIDKARTKVLDEIREAVSNYENGKQDWAETMYRVRKNYNFDIPCVCYIDSEDDFQVAMYSDLEPSDEKLTLVGYINYHW